ncbi:MAG: pilus assembly protein N-terminal domain-containing protein [Candidatus Melainabacteria bacterium]|nr:pilus assembly protein N-terminal domain-containing protein [Candidatus Melainabacteria bacterium]
MNKNTTSLILSLSVLVGQMGLLVQPATAAEAIWQQMSGSKTGNAPKAPVRKAVKKTVKKTATVAKRPSIKKVATAGSIADNHVMLFLGNKNKAAETEDIIPAAALSLHPSLLQADNLSTAASDTNDIVALKSSPTQSAASMSEVTTDHRSHSQQLIAQLAPDQVIAQSTSSGVTATPIPPVVTGAVDLEEFKTTNEIDLKVSQSRTFKMRNKIVRTSISDPGIAEPVVVAENQMVLLGKAPGSTTMVLWDDAGNTAAVDIVVSRDFSELQTALREIDPRIIVKAFSVGGSDRVLLMGDVDHPESVTRAMMACNVFMDDRGFNIQVANNRLINARIGEQGAGGGGSAGGNTGQLATLSSVDRYTFFPNVNNNVSKGQIITSDGGRVTSLIKVRKVPLIILHVTFMEMNTTSARKLATALGIDNTSRGFAFGVGGTNTTGVPIPNSYGGLNQGISTTFIPASFPASLAPVANGPVPTGFSTAPVGFFSGSAITSGDITGVNSGIGQGLALQAPQVLQNSVLFGAPGGASFGLDNLLNLFNATSNWDGRGQTHTSITPNIQGLINQQRARILSEPSLVCISGERAAFLAGGEIPILQAIAAGGQAQQSVVFEPFGLRINFIPVLMENGSLTIEISPEERVPSTQNSLNVPGSTTLIPSFITRKAQTTVEMKPGQELFIGGLITSNSGRELTKLPLIGEIPVIGAMYRSKAFAKNESELVVAIRPEIILPGTPGQLKLPEEIGRVEGPRDTNLFQVEPTVLDERYFSTGRAERHQKTSPTLPEGAPIPDSN